MSLLSALATDNSIEVEKDSVGVGFGPLDSGLYNATIAMAYIEQSKGGAMGLNLTLKTDAGREVRQTLWMTSGREKGQKNYYEKDGTKHYLPGFNLAQSLCLLTIAKEISQLETEKKVVKLYSYEAKAEVPTQVDCLTDLIGKEIIAGVLRQTVDKNVKNDAGAYVPSGETRDENEIDKFFRARDKMTFAEIRAQATEPAFYAAWDAKWTGNTRNKAKGAGSNNGAAGAPKLATSNGKPTSSLFG